jgi:hypothetical protein
MVTGRDFGAEKITGFRSTSSQFEDCRFGGLDLGWKTNSPWFGSGKAMSEYRGCVFDGARLRGILGGRVRFIDCSFRGVRINTWFAYEVELIDCVFSGRLEKAVFNGSVPEEARGELGRVKNEFRGNDFSQMQLKDVGFRSGVDLRLQRLPEGPDYLYTENAAAVLLRARAEILAWDNLELRQVVLRLLANDEEQLQAGQEQLFLDLRSSMRVARKPRGALVSAYRRALADIG